LAKMRTANDPNRPRRRGRRERANPIMARILGRSSRRATVTFLYATRRQLPTFGGTRRQASGQDHSNSCGGVRLSSDCGSCCRGFDPRQSPKENRHLRSRIRVARRQL
jgi:hypothetical protein